MEERHVMSSYIESVGMSSDIYKIDTYIEDRHMSSYIESVQLVERSFNSSHSPRWFTTIRDSTRSLN